VDRHSNRSLERKKRRRGFCLESGVLEVVQDDTIVVASWLSRGGRKGIGRPLYPAIMKNGEGDGRGFSWFQGVGDCLRGPINVKGRERHRPVPSSGEEESYILPPFPQEKK